MEDMEQKPTFVYRDGMQPSAQYVEWLSDVKARFCQSQIKASIRVNTAMLEFYWSIGRDLAAMRVEERWGAGVVKQFALDMRQAFPDVTGFSYSNIKYMKQWYLFYFERVIKGQQLADQIENGKSHQVAGLIAAAEKGQQLVDQIEMTEKGHQVGDQLEIPEIFCKRLLTAPWQNWN